MRQRIKTTIRSFPRLFDALKRMSRVMGSPDPAYEFFSRYSRMRGNRVNFLQIGAADGMRNDPFREFIVGGWRGILVEPIPQAFELLKANYSHLADRLTLLNVAVTREDGSMTLYAFDAQFLAGLPVEQRLDYLRKVSFDRAHVEHYLPADQYWAITQTTVPCLSIGTLLARHWDGSPIHLLAIDAEGHEPEIIAGIDFKTFVPETIFYESHTLKSTDSARLTELLAAHGYESFAVLGDTVAMQAHVLAEYRDMERKRRGH
ncbi:MAG: FkbM family methyltransferase [Burkholderiaceae bacterium]|nr:FkbM family methyltransferase [Burkholderiaceae bacterium]